MPLTDDGDIFRAHGFVAIRFAWLEDCLEDRLEEAYPLVTPDKQARFRARFRYWRFSDQVRHLRDLLIPALELAQYEHNEEDRRETEHVLEMCEDVAESRHDALHSPILGDPRTGDAIRHSKRRKQYSVVRSAEVYRLADEIDDLEQDLFRMRFVITRLCGRDPFTDYEGPLD